MSPCLPIVSYTRYSVFQRWRPHRILQWLRPWELVSSPPKKGKQYVTISFVTKNDCTDLINKWFVYTEISLQWFLCINIYRLWPKVCVDWLTFQVRQKLRVKMGSFTPTVSRQLWNFFREDGTLESPTTSNNQVYPLLKILMSFQTCQQYKLWNSPLSLFVYRSIND